MIDAISGQILKHKTESSIENAKDILTAKSSDGKDNDGDKTCDYNGCDKNRNIHYPKNPNCDNATDNSESS
ncbi:MAG: hypothetical protein U9O53_03895 [archaeon]|nr:hypothetical protein [archaeon]